MASTLVGCASLSGNEVVSGEQEGGTNDASSEGSPEASSRTDASLSQNGLDGGSRDATSDESDAMGEAEASLDAGPGAKSDEALWAKTEQARTTESLFLSAVVDVSGNVIVAGTAGPSMIDFGNQVVLTPASSVDSNAFLVTFDSSGMARRGQTVAAGSNASLFSSIVLDSSGNLYAAG
jgi:hypothetical protein